MCCSVLLAEGAPCTELCASPLPGSGLASLTAAPPSLQALSHAERAILLLQRHLWAHSLPFQVGVAAACPPPCHLACCPTGLVAHRHSSTKSVLFVAWLRPQRHRPATPNSLTPSLPSLPRDPGPQDGLNALVRQLAAPGASRHLLASANVLAMAYHNAAVEHEKLARLREALVSFTRCVCVCVWGGVAPVLRPPSSPPQVRPSRPAAARTAGPPAGWGGGAAGCSGVRLAQAGGRALWARAHLRHHTSIPVSHPPPPAPATPPPSRPPQRVPHRVQVPGGQGPDHHLAQPRPQGLPAAPGAAPAHG